MNTQVKQQLNELFHEIDSEFPDKSGAFILEITAERARIQNIKHDCDAGDVAESL